MIVSIIDIYQDIARHDKLIFSSAITRILTHLHVTIPSTPFLLIMVAITQGSLQKSDAQLASKAKWPRNESTRTQQEEAAFHAAKDAAYATQPSSSSAPSTSSRVEASLATILDQLQHMHADFGSRLDHLSDEMCQMNIRIGRIARHQSCLGGFAPSPSPKPTEDSFDGGDDAFGSSNDDEMTTSQ